MVGVAGAWRELASLQAFATDGGEVKPIVFRTFGHGFGTVRPRDGSSPVADRRAPRCHREIPCATIFLTEANRLDETRREGIGVRGIIDTTTVGDAITELIVRRDDPTASLRRDAELLGWLLAERLGVIDKIGSVEWEGRVAAGEVDQDVAAYLQNNYVRDVPLGDDSVTLG